MNAQPLQNFFALPLVGILRGCSPDHLPHIIAAVRNGGMCYLEITMNTPGAAEQIRRAIDLAQGSIEVGAGTVTTPQLLDDALNAGAQFIVTPNCVAEIITYCEEAGVPIFPGAFTPTEIYNAWSLGPTQVRAVKIFPADCVGPKYIRALKAPFPDIRLMPTGGVDLATLPAFVEAGADAFGIGSPLFRKDRLEANDWCWLENQTRAFVEAYKSARARVNAAAP